MNYLNFKILVVGDPQMGKTTLVQTIESNRRPDAGYKATIGVNYVISSCTVGKKQVTLQLWDIAGQERLMRNLRMYYEHAYLALIVVSVEKAESVLAEESFVEKQIEFFRSTDYVIPNSSRMLPLGLVISKWDLVADQENADELKKRLQKYGEDKGFAFTEFTSVYEDDLSSVKKLKEEIVNCCLEISNSQTLRVQFLGSTRTIEKFAKFLKPEYNPASLTDSFASGHISIPLDKMPGTDKTMTLDVRPDSIPSKPPMYSEPNVVGIALIISADDFTDKTVGQELVQHLVSYVQGTRGIKIHNYEDIMKKCVILLDNCEKNINAKDHTSLTSAKDITLKSFPEDLNKSEVMKFMYKMSAEWNAVFETEDMSDGDEVDLGQNSDSGTDEVQTKKPSRGGCACGHH